VFRILGGGQYAAHKVSCYAVELYCGELVDLLAPEQEQEEKAAVATWGQDEKGTTTHAKKLVVRYNKNSRRITVENATVETAADAVELRAIFERANGNRHVAATLMNASSSRSHLVCSIVVETTSVKGEVRRGKLTLVDLAGSERTKRSGVKGTGMKEANSINKSLLALGNVIHALTIGERVPYRNHDLTMLLQDSLGGLGAKTLMFVNVSPALDNEEETRGALDFAMKARQVVNRAETKEVAKLKAQLAAAMTLPGTPAHEPHEHLKQTTKKV
jgi:hypothetical protein